MCKNRNRRADRSTHYICFAMKKEVKTLWACPKCGREFERKGQSHSCRVFPLERHFEGKPGGKLLYEKFKQAVEKRIGLFKVDSVECCIHFVHSSTFLAVKVFKDKIQVEFGLNHPVESRRVGKFAQISANRYLHYVDVDTEDEIDEELMEWAQEAHDLKADSSVH